MLPLCAALMTPHQECCVGVPNLRRTWTCWSESRGGQKDAQVAHKRVGERFFVRACGDRTRGDALN